MKFCRFELLTDEGAIRTGIAYEGRIYETDGTNAIGIHEASDIRILTPIGRPPSVRVFRPGDKAFDYVHPAAMYGPNALLGFPEHAERLGYSPCLAVVSTAGPVGIPSAEADELLLGLTLAHFFSTLRDTGGRALDVGYCVGPALVTPDEFGSETVRKEKGALYEDTVTLWRNGVEITKLDLKDMTLTPAQAMSIASETQPLVEGDLLLVPIADVDLRPEPLDEIKLSGTKLGMLAMRLGAL